MPVYNHNQVVSMTLYIDLCFLTNFIMNFIILFITSVMAKSPIRKTKIAVASAVESLFYCLLVWQGFVFLTSGRILAFIFNLAVIKFLFKPPSIKNFIELIVITTITSFTICGLAIWIFNFSNIPEAIFYFFKNGYAKYTVVVLAASALGSYAFIKLFGKWIDTVYSDRKKYCRIRFFYKSNCAEVTALIDSGNFLKSKTGGALVIVETGAAAGLFKENVKSRGFNSNIISEILEPEERNRLSYINYSSLGTESGRLLTFNADKAQFIFSKNESVFISAEIAFYDGIISPKGGYSAIVGYDEYFKIREMLK